MEIKNQEIKNWIKAEQEKIALEFQELEKRYAEILEEIKAKENK